MKTTKGNLEKGITLVALIITIIVMLILVGVTVAVVVDSDIIGQAEQAGEAYKDAYASEADKVDDETIEGEVRHNTIDGYLQDACKQHDLDENGKCKKCGLQLIEFTVANRSETETYNAEADMTWEQWINSKYNTADLIIYPGYEGVWLSQDSAIKCGYCGLESCEGCNGETTYLWGRRVRYADDETVHYILESDLVADFSNYDLNDDKILPR